MAIVHVCNIALYLAYMQGLFICKYHTDQCTMCKNAGRHVTISTKCKFSVAAYNHNIMFRLHSSIQ